MPRPITSEELFSGCPPRIKASETAHTSQALRLAESTIPSLSTGRILAETVEIRDDREGEGFFSLNGVLTKLHEDLHGRKERALEGQFVGLVTDLDIQDVIKVNAGQNPPRGYTTDYRLAPLIPAEPAYTRLSLTSIYTATRVPEGVRVHYGGEGKNPCLDASFAIGLVYKDVLTAVAAAGIDEAGRLLIVQLQSSIKPGSFNGAAPENGLSKLFWRDTLVTGWERIAERLGTTTAIQSSLNNVHAQWADPEGKRRFYKGYDGVAQRMNYNPDPLVHDWYLQSFQVQ